MGGLFPPSVLLIDNLPLKPSLHKSGGSVNAGAPEYCLTDGDTHFSSRDFPYIAPFISEGVFQYHPFNAWHPSLRLVASQIDFQEETLLHEHCCDIFGLLSPLSVQFPSDQTHIFHPSLSGGLLAVSTPCFLLPPWKGLRRSSTHLSWKSFWHKQTKARRNKHKVKFWTLWIPASHILLLLPWQAVWQLPACWQGSLLFFHLPSHRIPNAFSTVAFSFVSLRATTSFLAATRTWTVECQRGNYFSLQPFHKSLQSLDLWVSRTTDWKLLTYQAAHGVHIR